LTRAEGVAAVNRAAERSQLQGFPAQWILHFGGANLSKSSLFSGHPYGEEPDLDLRILERWITAKSGSGTFN